MIIAMDGPAGTGKSTIASIIAKKLNMNQIHITINVEEFSGAKVIEFKMQ